MKKRTKKLALLTAIGLTSLFAGLELSEQYQSSAIDTNRVLYKQGSIGTVNNFDFTIRDQFEGARFWWGKAGTTTVQTNARQLGSDQGEPVFELTQGAEFRLTNVGETIKTNKKLDLIITVESLGRAYSSYHGDRPIPDALYNTPKHGGFEATNSIRFSNSKNVSPGGYTDKTGTDPYESIAIQANGYESARYRVRVVEAGTNNPVSVTAATYWSDVDVNQGIKETMSNEQATFSEESKAYLAVDDNGYVYSKEEQPGRNAVNRDGMNEADKTAYLGTGNFSEFTIDFVNRYRGPESPRELAYDASERTPAGVLGGYGYRFDLFGKFDNLNLIEKEPVLTDAKKTVSDSNEREVENNTLGINEQSFGYTVSVNSRGDGPYRHLVIKDTIPAGLTVDPNSVIIHADNDLVTGLFDTTLKQNNELSVKLKASAYDNPIVHNKKLTLSIPARVANPDQSYSAVYENKAVIETEANELETNTVRTKTLSKGSAEKLVSVKQGQPFIKADTINKAGTIGVITDEYHWKSVFTLPNKTEYQSIKLQDFFEAGQQYNPNRVEVWYKNQLITNRGVLTAVDKTNSDTNSNYKELSWVANEDFLREFNQQTTENEAPVFELHVKTNYDPAAPEKTTEYKRAIGLDPNSKRLIQKNKAVAIVSDALPNEHAFTTNDSFVEFKSIPQSFTKQVNDKDEKAVETNTLGLNETEQSYTLTLQTTNGKDASIRVVDQLPAEFTPNEAGITIKNNQADLKGLFTIQKRDRALEFVLKDTEKNNPLVIGATIKFTIPGTVNKANAQPFTNQAVVESDNAPIIETNTVTTNPTSELAVVKTVSVNQGPFEKADTVETTKALTKANDEYRWRLTTKLPNKPMNSIIVRDELLPKQLLDKNAVVVKKGTEDYSGKGVLNYENGVLSWTANQDALPALINGDLIIEFPVRVKDLSVEERNALSQNGKLLIPNQASVQASDASGNKTAVSNSSFVKLPAVVETATKTVSDSNEQNTRENWIGLKEKEQQYELSVKTSPGDYLTGLVISDQLPNGFEKTAVRVLAGDKDVTGLFTITDQNGLIKAELKQENKQKPELMNAVVRVLIEGRVTGDSGLLENKALVVDGQSDNGIETNTVVTRVASSSSLEKLVSSDGNSFSKKEQAQDSLMIEDKVHWKGVFRLPSNYRYESLVIKDSLKAGQLLEDNSLTIQYHNQNVTEQFTVSNDNGLLTLTPKAGFIQTLTNDSKQEQPVITVQYKTTVPAESDKTEFITRDAGLAIPNQFVLTMKSVDDNKTTELKTNESFITTPVSIISIDKLVNDNNEKQKHKNTLTLGEKELSYTIKTKTTAGKELKAFVIKDQLPKGTSLKENSVVIRKGDKELTGLFTVKNENGVVTATIKPENKNNPDLINAELFMSFTVSVDETVSGALENKAVVFDGFLEQETKPTTTIVPEKPTVGKTIQYKEFNSPKEKLDSFKDNYSWVIKTRVPAAVEPKTIRITDTIKDATVDRLSVFFGENDVTQEFTVDKKEGQDGLELTVESKDSFKALLNRDTSIERPELRVVINSHYKKANTPNTKETKNKAVVLIKDHERFIPYETNEATVVYPEATNGVIKEFIKKTQDNDWQAVVKEESDKALATVLDYRVQYELGQNKAFSKEDLGIRVKLPKELVLKDNQAVSVQFNDEDKTKDFSIKETEDGFFIQAKKPELFDYTSGIITVTIEDLVLKDRMTEKALINAFDKAKQNNEKGFLFESMATTTETGQKLESETTKAVLISNYSITKTVE